MTVFAYYRVSTDHQDYESQKIGVVEYAKRAGLTIDKEYLDNGVSGTIIAKKRNLGKLLKEMKKGDTIITGELSRLGRSTVDVITTCNLIAQSGVNCYMVKQGMSIDQTPMGKLVVAIFSAFAEMERDLISQRTKEGLARRKSKGFKLGRAVGTKNKRHKLDDCVEEIIKKYTEGFSVRLLAKIYHVGLNTIKNRLKESGVKIRDYTPKAHITTNGQCAVRVAIMNGITRNTFYNRIIAGWDAEKAATTPMIYSPKKWSYGDRILREYGVTVHELTQIKKQHNLTCFKDCKPFIKKGDG